MLYNTNKNSLRKKRHFAVLLLYPRRLESPYQPCWWFCVVLTHTICFKCLVLSFIRYICRSNKQQHRSSQYPLSLNIEGMTLFKCIVLKYVPLARSDSHPPSLIHTHWSDSQQGCHFKHFLLSKGMNMDKISAKTNSNCSCGIRFSLKKRTCKSFWEGSNRSLIYWLCTCNPLGQGKLKNWVP
jgi:hypothetical protein